MNFRIPKGHAQNTFNEERIQLQKQCSVSFHSKLLNLSQFIDDYGLLRVVGRLRNSELDHEIQHSIILPKDSRILNEFHERNLHPGVSSLFVIARQSYWILEARDLIRRLTHNCLKCFRYRQQNSQ